MRLRGLVALAAAAAFVLAPAGAPSGAANPELLGTVGPGFSIRLSNPDGSIVTKVDPGTYDIVVRDLSEEHNFHLSGPGVDRFTSVEQTANVTWTVTFVEGRYDYVCDPHSTLMKGEFVAGNPPPEPAPAPLPTPAPAVKKLLLTVGPDRDDHAPERGRQGAAGAQSRQLHDRRPRPLEAAQRPPGRQGRQPQVRPGSHGHADVEGEAPRRGAPLLLRSQPEDGQGSITST